MKEKMTLRELMESRLFDSDTKFYLVTTGDDIEYDPDDYFVSAAFGDHVVYKAEAKGENAVRIFFDIEAKVRRATA